MDDITSKRALLEKIADLVPYCGHCDGYGFVQLDCVEDAVKEAPTVDAVPVIRCKECKYGYYGEGGYNGRFNAETGISMHCKVDGYGKLRDVYENDFCSYGERKENETN